MKKGSDDYYIVLLVLDWIIMKKICYQTKKRNLILYFEDELCIFYFFNEII